ncbi:MAG: hypothetical protein ABI673_06290 [Novosphingobium sp.]
MDAAPASILILGASYGLLPGVKLALAGHAVTFVGQAKEIAAMSAGPLEVRLSLRRGGGDVALRVPVAQAPMPGFAALRTPEQVNADDYQFVILAMQEPQYRAPAIADLMTRIAAAARPCLSIMNLPPRAYLERFGTIDPAAFKGVYSSEAVWQGLDPRLVSLTSPDAQAVRLDPAQPGQLTVTLASNFKAAPFERPEDQALLERLARGISGVKVMGEGGLQRAPVQLLAQKSLFAPLAKWPMLLTGNCRCFSPDGIRSIGETVLSDPAASAVIYAQVLRLLVAMGADERSLVSFASYARAAEGLTRPSSLARALASGAKAVERIDRLVLNLMHLHGITSPEIEAIVATIERQIAVNNAS